MSVELAMMMDVRRVLRLLMAELLAHQTLFNIHTITALTEIGAEGQARAETLAELNDARAALSVRIDAILNEIEGGA